MWQAAEQHLITRRHGRALPSIGKLQTTYRKDSSLPPSATTRRVVAGTLVTTQIWTRAGALVFALLLKQVMIRIEGIRAPGVLGFLRPEAQRAIKLVGLVVMVTFVIASLAWGYQQRQIAHNWQKLACTYRLQDSVRRAPIMADVLDARDSCATLEFLGLKFGYPALGVSEVSAAPRRDLAGGGS